MMWLLLFSCLFCWISILPLFILLSHRDEFRKHKNVDSAYMTQFLAAWDKYYDGLVKSPANQVRSLFPVQPVDRQGSVQRGDGPSRRRPEEAAQQTPSRNKPLVWQRREGQTLQRCKTRLSKYHSCFVLSKQNKTRIWINNWSSYTKKDRK